MGGAQIREAERWAVDLGLKAVKTDLRATQTHAVTMLETMGYERWGTLWIATFVDGQWVQGIFALGLGIMILFPAIDLKGGQVVRLFKGDLDRATVYGDDPGAQAETLKIQGFKWLHVVDLDGAVDGKPVNRHAVEQIIAGTSNPIQLGGGIRSLEHIEAWLSAGVSRVILGTVALRNPSLVKQACQQFPGQIVVGIDARDGMVAVEGWLETGTTAVWIWQSNSKMRVYPPLCLLILVVMAP